MKLKLKSVDMIFIK